MYVLSRARELFLLHNHHNGQQYIRIDSHMRLPVPVDVEAGGCAAVQVEGGGDREVGRDQQVGHLIEREDFVGTGNEEQVAVFVHCHNAAAALRGVGVELCAFAALYQHG